MKAILLVCIGSMAASAPIKTEYGTVVTVLTNPIHRSNHNPKNSINDSHGETGSQEEMNMHDKLNDKVANNTNSLIEVKDDVSLLEKLIMEMQQQILLQQQLQQQQQQQELLQLVIRPNCTVNESLSCEKSIVDGTQHPYKPWYSPSNVFIDSCDSPTTPLKEESVNWWAAPDNATGDRAFFVVGLGCQRCVSKIIVRNSGHGSAVARGTKEFLVSLATESEPDNWIPVIKGKLADIRGLKCEDQPGKKTFQFAAMRARFVRFEVLSFYGKGAAIQYFNMH